MIHAQRFLARRGWTQSKNRANWQAARRAAAARSAAPTSAVQPLAGTPATATWQPLGPTAVASANFGLVTGRVSALALDPSDATGNHLYVGTTGGGVWVSQNAGASSTSSITFTPLTDSLGVLSGATDASISIGALTVQPGGMGVILAGTGDPNDVLDSYYGAGILRSTDGGNTWNLISTTVDFESGLSNQDYSFVGEGFAGFAWSTVSPQQVVAAVSQAYEGTLVDADRSGVSYEGLYYSTDSGATWHLATITDGSGEDVQGPIDAFAGPDGNAATSVAWNPMRQLFVAAVRYHGYYQSPDGVTWTRMTAQPGANLTTAFCPNNLGSTGSIDCPIFRGTVAVNPLTGDTFAWTVATYDQSTGEWHNGGIWQDQCAINISGNACTNTAITFATELPWFPGTSSTEPMIANGDYTLALAAVPAAVGLGEDTLLFAGANDLWKCSLAMGCAWRNTTNSTAGFCSNVAEYQHSLAWNTANPLEIFLGNDSGLWRSVDQVGETGPVCSASDASHFQNLNGSLGSLAEVESISATGISSYTMMAGLGVNGTAGVKSSTGPTADWPRILGGDGGPVAIDPSNSENWYVNNEEGVSIYLCSQSNACTPAAFGASPVITGADVGGDGLAMATAAPFLVDPLDPTQLLIGTCRVWRGPASGVGWSSSNAISPILDQQASPGPCSGNSLIRSLAAMATTGGGEVVYVGTYGALVEGGNAAGQVFSITYNSATGWSAPRNLTQNPVTAPSESGKMNALDLDISSLYIDTHDVSGQTVYATVEGFSSPTQAVPTIYRSINGGASWANLTGNLPWAPASSVVVDPQSATTVYVATDVGVFFTTEIGSCTNPSPVCWSAFGTGLPQAPAVQLSAAPLDASAAVLTAGTYGRGIWQTPLWSSQTGLTTAITTPPNPVIFTTPVPEYSSSTLTVTVMNTGSLALVMPSPDTSMGGNDSADFSVTTDDCQGATVQPGGACILQVTFAPIAVGALTAQMTIYANVYGGQLPAVEFSGTATAAGVVTLTPAAISFDPAPGQSSLLLPVPVGTTSGSEQVEAGNSGGAAISITNIAITSPFKIASNGCGTSTLAPGGDCQMMLAFAPTQRGAATGTLTFTEGAKSQTVALSGFGWAPPTDTLSAASLSFGGIVVGQSSPVRTITLSNTGDLPLKGISITVSGPFTESDNCDGQLAANYPLSSCAISVQFAPNASQLGSQSGTLTVTDALRVQPVTLSGTGLAAPAIGFSPPAGLSFSLQEVGVASSLTLTVTNTGGAPLANLSFTIPGSTVPGSQASYFAIGANTCPVTSGSTLAAGSSCTVQVIFTPLAAGGSAATLVISSSNATAVSAPLSGSGQVTAGLNVSPPQLTFGPQSPGQPSAAQTVIISNTAGVASSTPSLSINNTQFSLTANTCTGNLAAGTNCTVGVIYTPTGSTAAGLLTVSSATFATQATVVLNGTAGGPGSIQVKPSPISFGTVGVNTISSPITVTVTNPWTATTMEGLAITPSAGFQLANGARTCAASLGPGASCTVGVVFAPASVGAQNGALAITSSTASASGSVALSGNGFDFSVVVSGSNTDTVAAGQIAYYTMAITPLSGSPGGTFSFACGTLPANALCIFDPTGENVSAGATGYETVEISTGQSSSSSLAPGPARGGVLLLACGLALLPLTLPLTWRRRRKALFMAALLAILAGSVSSCTSSGGGTGGGGGGGSGGSGNSSLTPVGTYAISVSVTSNGVTHTLAAPTGPLALTVD
ncbi:MAG: choice-of-anchor D domain-containing protein [Terracidiphilus sp.]